MSEDVRLDLLKDAISESGLDGQAKDALADDLRYAQTINGTKDDALQGIKRLVISGVRRELLAHARTSKAISDGVLAGISEHVKTCKGDMRLGGSRALSSTVIAVASGLRPIAWPLAFICFSPNAVEIFRLVINVFSKQ